MPSQSKFALFKQNRSQLSLSSNKSGQKRQSFYDQSPTESPLHSPTTTTSPGGNTIQSAEGGTLSSTNKEEEDNTLRGESTDPRNRYRQSTNPLQRSQSQRSPRSPPSAPPLSNHLLDLDSKQAQRPPRPTRLVKKTNPIPEAKKKKTFWGFGYSSSSRKSPAQNNHEHGPSHLTQGAAPPRANSELGEQQNQQNWQSSSRFPSTTTVEEESEEDIVTKNFYRHSVVFPTNFAPSDPSSPDSPSNQDYNYTRLRSPPFTTASSQQSSEQEGKAPAWERIGRGPHHRNPSDQPHQTLHPSQSATNPSSGSKVRLDLAFTDTSNSRPPSRQSIEPPSPSSFSHGPFIHQRSGSSQKSSFIEGPMVPNSQQHPSGRGSEAPQQNAPSGSRGEGMARTTIPVHGELLTWAGQYGSTLSVNNQQSGSYRNTPQASPMVQENSRDGQGRSTPPPARSRDDLGNLDVQQLLSRHEELSTCPSSSIVCLNSDISQTTSTEKSKNTISTRTPKCNNYKIPLLISDWPNLEPRSTTTNTRPDFLVSMAQSTTLPSIFEKTGAPYRRGLRHLSTKMQPTR